MEKPISDNSVSQNSSKTRTVEKINNVDSVKRAVTRWRKKNFLARIYTIREFGLKAVHTSLNQGMSEKKCEASKARSQEAETETALS